MNNNVKKPKKFNRWRFKRCWLTDNKVVWIDYKDKEMLSRFINRQGKILPGSATGTKTILQRRLAISIKRARHIGVLPFTAESIMQSRPFHKDKDNK